MDSTLIKILYTNAFNDIESARSCQISISQKEMELQMININSKYSSFDNFAIENAGANNNYGTSEEIKNHKLYQFLNSF